MRMSHTDTIIWPDWMPNPLVDGYGIRPVDRRLKTEMEVSGISAWNSIRMNASAIVR